MGQGVPLNTGYNADPNNNNNNSNNNNNANNAVQIPSYNHRNPPELKPIVAASSSSYAATGTGTGASNSNNNNNNNNSTSPTSLSTSAQGPGLGTDHRNNQPPQPTLPRIKSARKDK